MFGRSKKIDDFISQAFTVQIGSSAKKNVSEKQEKSINDLFKSYDIESKSFTFGGISGSQNFSVSGRDLAEKMVIAVVDPKRYEEAMGAPFVGLAHHMPGMSEITRNFLKNEGITVGQGVAGTIFLQPKNLEKIDELERVALHELGHGASNISGSYAHQGLYKDFWKKGRSLAESKKVDKNDAGQMYEQFLGMMKEHGHEEARAEMFSMQNIERKLNKNNKPIEYIRKKIKNNFESGYASPSGFKIYSDRYERHMRWVYEQLGDDVQHIPGPISGKTGLTVDQLTRESMQHGQIVGAGTFQSGLRNISGEYGVSQRKRLDALRSEIQKKLSSEQMATFDSVIANTENRSLTILDSITRSTNITTSAEMAAFPSPFLETEANNGFLHFTDAARSELGSEKISQINRVVEKGMSGGEEIFTLGGLTIGQPVHPDQITRSALSIISPKSEFREKSVYEARYQGAGFNSNHLTDSQIIETTENLLGKERASQINVGEVRNFITLDATQLNERPTFFASQGVLHEYGHSATLFSKNRDKYSFMDYTPINATRAPIIHPERRPNAELGALRQRYIDNRVNLALEESRAETYGYHKLFQSSEMLDIGKEQGLFHQVAYYGGFGSGIYERPFQHMYGDMLGGKEVDEMTKIFGEIHANAALVATVGFGKGDESQLPFLHKHIADTRSRIASQYGEITAKEYDSAVAHYGRLGRFGLSSDGAHIAEGVTRREAEKVAHAKMGDVLLFGMLGNAEPQKLSARIASKELPRTVEEGVEEVVKHSGATRNLLKAATETSSHVAAGAGSSRLLKEAGAFMSIFRRRV